MSIYLHEIVNVVPTRAADYLDGIGQHHGVQRAARGEKATMLGLWMVLEASGTWPLAVNLWENRTWEKQAEMMASQFEPKAQNPELKRWWLDNLHLRRGGFDRLIESTDYSPDVEGLRAQGVSGRLFLHQIVHLAGGRVEDYLGAFGREGVPALNESGAQLVGAYRVRLRDDEAITILAFREARDLARCLASWHDGDAASPLHRWRLREDEWVRGKETMLMKARHFLTSPWHL